MQWILSKAVLSVSVLMIGFKVLPLSAQLEPVQIPGKFDLSNRTQLTQSGFQLRIHQANEVLENTKTEREKVLNGSRPDFLGFPLENFAKETGAQNVDWVLGHTFLMEGSIDLEQAGNPSGEVNDEQTIPGIPGFEDQTTFLTSEILMLLEIPEPGTYSFGINASGGFRVVTGNIHDLLDVIQIANIEGHQEAATTRFDLEFEQAGIYQFRTLWYTGEGDASFEWWTLDPEENPVLLNSEFGLRTFSNQPEALSSFVQSIPAPSETGVLLNQPTLEIQIQHDLDHVENDSIEIRLNENPVSPQLQVKGDTLTISIALEELSPFTRYDWTLQFDSAIGTREISSSFTTTVFGAEGLLFIEAEDFDFNRGQWEQLNPIGMTGPYPGGAYRDRGNGINETDVAAGTDFGVDYFEDPNTNDKPVYRPNTGVETVRRASQEDTHRGTFSVITNHSVSDNMEGEWLNYTRDFPLTNSGSKMEYNVFARASSGDKPILVSLDRVTKDAETEDITLEPLALLNPGRTTEGWDAFEIFPLRTVGSEPGEGDSLATVELGGNETLRITTLPESSHELDYLIFLPTTTNNEPGAIVSFSRDGNSLIIEYTGTLKRAETLDGEYSPVEGASSPFTASLENTQGFFIAE